MGECGQERMEQLVDRKEVGMCACLEEGDINPMQTARNGFSVTGEGAYIHFRRR